jgi:hypothetical protein
MIGGGEVAVDGLSELGRRPAFRLEAQIWDLEPASSPRRTPSKPNKSSTRRADRSHVVVDEGGLEVLRDPDASSESAVDAAHDLVLGRRGRTTGGAMVDGDRRKPPGPGDGGAASVHRVREIQRDRLGLAGRCSRPTRAQNGREIPPVGGIGALG